MNALLNPEALALPRRTTADEVFSLHASSVSDSKVRKFKQLIMAWINIYLREDKIYVRDMVEDLHDGQLLLLFLEKVTKADFGSHVGAIAQTSKRENLNIVMKACKERLGIVLEDGILEGILEKDFVSIARLCVELAHKLKCPYQLPSNIEVVVVHREPLKTGGSMTKTSRHRITGDETGFGTPEAELIDRVHALSTATDVVEESEDVARERDAFDELFEPSQAEKLESVKKLLMVFVNKHLAGCGVSVANLGLQFHDGVYLIILIGALGNVFVPLYNFHISPTTTEMKMFNVNYAIKLMNVINIPKGRWTAEQIVKQDVRATLRALYAIFTAFKNAPA